jgi:CDGSH-type Zn-finger protein
MTRITVLPNASNKIIGDIEEIEYKGKKIPVKQGEDVYLCRCGGSCNKPFCDGTHAKINFKD